MSRCRACLTMNGPPKRKCEACGKQLPKRRRPGHLKALKEPLEVFVEANDGYDGCWVCRDLGLEFKGKPQRDHWHSGPLKGHPRGILCPYHNRKLGAVYTPELLGSLHRYVSRKAAA